jgi:hypothetical protein
MQSGPIRSMRGPRGLMEVRELRLSYQARELTPNLLARINVRSSSKSDAKPGYRRNVRVGQDQSSQA